jgi:hypothetical protein
MRLNIKPALCWRFSAALAMMVFASLFAALPSLNPCAEQKIWTMVDDDDDRSR